MQPSLPAIIEKDLKGQDKISNEHIENSKAVRKILKERGVKPEELPAAEDIKKVKRKHETEEKKIPGEIKKLKNKS